MLNQDPRQADFVLGTCPECQKVVRIPVTAVTSQSKSQVRCPICDSSFEIADILEETIPSVEVIDDVRPSSSSPGNDTTEKSQPTPERINAIDTPELFHVNKGNHRPTTEKKNGRFVVPELLSKGIKKKKKKRGRRSRSHDDPKLRESLEKLKQNTSATSLNRSLSGDAESHDKSHRESSRSRSDGSRSKSRSGRSEKKRSGSGSSHSSKSRKRELVRVEKKPAGFFGHLVAVRSFYDLQRLFRMTMAGMNKRVDKSELSKHDSKLEYAMVGIGMLLAIPMLHLMMWWFAGIDPLGLAKPTSRVMPFFVPNELQAKKVDDETLSETEIKAELEAVDSPRVYQSNSELKMIDGKLPKPKIDPDSVHSDDY